MEHLWQNALSETGSVHPLGDWHPSHSTQNLVQLILLYSISLIYKGLIIGVPVLLVYFIILGLSSEKPAKIPDYHICTSMIHREVIVESMTPILCVQKANLLLCYLSLLERSIIMTPFQKENFSDTVTTHCTVWVFLCNFPVVLFLSFQT